MFPYPSGAGLHVGHPVGYIGSDIISRYRRMRGDNVLHPMGWDAFGLPAEQYAIETGVHPAETTRQAIDSFRRQLQRLGFSYDWDREFATIDTEYYRWTQWIWLQAYNAWYDHDADKARPITDLIAELESGNRLANGERWSSLDDDARRSFLDDHRLAFISEQVVNWCPALGTALANEEVIDGRSERGGHTVHRLPLRQWMFRITEYADRLLADLDELDWPESTRIMQTEWIGRSEGADILFDVIGGEALRVYTTRPDTIFGATFMVIAPEHPLVDAILSNSPDGCDDDAVRNYVKETRNRADVDRMADSGEKSGVFSGLHAVNPATCDEIPVWIADYVLMGYGHGAIMAVPAHDERDHAFAAQHGIPVNQVVAPPTDAADEPCYSGDGTAMNSAGSEVTIDGLATAEAKATIIDWLEESNRGEGRVNYRLRDWLFARQRYWGEPFPIVFDEHGDHYPISENALPVELPPLEDFTPVESGTPQPLLAKAEDWLHTTAGEAGVDASLLSPDTPVTREANTMPGWAGSCWYYLRYCSPRCDDRFVDSEAERYWLHDGVDLYIGGAEHAVLHLLYARFWHKMLHDLGEVSSSEPFRKMFHQGMLTSFAFQRSDSSLVPVDAVSEQPDGTFVEAATGDPVTRVVAKMSKSLRNVVNPDTVIEEYGADTMRLYEMYMGPLDASAPWNTRDIVGVHRFLQRLWRLAVDENTGELTVRDTPVESVERSLHAAIAKVGDDIERLAYNTAIAAMIEFVNVATAEGGVTGDQLNRFCRILGPFAPHIAEELHAMLGNDTSVSLCPWPDHDPAMLQSDEIELPVQIMGKVRGKVCIPAGADAAASEAAVLADPKIIESLGGASVRKVIVVPGKIINIVTGQP
jgi:leucyl-tRNA synthetase